MLEVSWPASATIDIMEQLQKDLEAIDMGGRSIEDRCAGICRRLHFHHKGKGDLLDENPNVNEDFDNNLNRDLNHFDDYDPDADVLYYYIMEHWGESFTLRTRDYMHDRQELATRLGKLKSKAR